MKKRLFVFGCSMTAYSWPTWADFLSLEYDEYENWALAGIGNRAIMERIVECHARNNLTADDTVIVQWSSHLRNDFFHKFSLPQRAPGWKTAGSIFNYLNLDLYDQKWVETFFFEPAYIMHTLNYISMVQSFLDNLGVKWFMTSMGDLQKLGADLIEGDGYGETVLSSEKDDLTLWKDYPELKIYYPLIWEKYKDKWIEPLVPYAKQTPKEFFEFFKIEDGTSFFDFHPTPRQHSRWLKEKLVPRLGISNIDESAHDQIVNSIEELHSMHCRNKSIFEQLLQRSKFDVPKKLTWPNFYRGFM